MKPAFKKTAALLMAAAITAAVPMADTASVGAVSYGWQGTEGASPFFNGNNTYATGVVFIDGIAYRFGSDGACLGTFSGFGTKDGKRRYYDNGVIFNRGWLRLDSGDYYFYSNGESASGEVTIDGRRYYFASDGRLLKDTQVITDAVTDPYGTGAQIVPSTPSTITPATPTTPAAPSAPTQSAGNITVASTGIFLTSSKDTVYTAKGDSITFTVSVNGIDGAVAVSDSFALHRYKNGNWIKVNPSQTTAILNSGTHYIGYVGDMGLYSSAHSVVFSPDTYSDKTLEPGKYRAVFNLMTEKGVVQRVCEFEVIAPVVAVTPQKLYYIGSTEKISFTAEFNTDAYVYAPEIFELQYYDPDRLQWVKTLPKSGYYTETDPVFAKAGTRVNAYLDLTRYSRSSMKSGKYRVMITDSLPCEFELKHAYTAEVTQRETQSKRTKQVLITVTNSSDVTVKAEGYGELWRLEKGKWKKISLKNGAKLNQSMEIPPKYKWSKSFTLTDYYNLSDLKAGSYSMSIPASDGSFVYAYFDLK